MVIDKFSYYISPILFILNILIHYCPFFILLTLMFCGVVCFTDLNLYYTGCLPFLPRVTRVTRVARGICVVRLHSGHSNCKITLKFQNVRLI